MWTFEVYKDRGGEFRWTLYSANGRKVAASGEGYDTRSNAKAAAERVKSNAGSAKIEDVY